MKQSSRIILAVVILGVVAALVLLTDFIRRQTAQPLEVASANVTLAPGSVPIYLNGALVGGFAPSELDQLQKVSFIEPVEGKSEEGWLLADVLHLYIPAAKLSPDDQITVTSTSRDKFAQLTWAEVANPDNMVMFDLSNRGTLKLVSKMEKLDTRDEWVQDTDKIEISTP
jgi:hypothetical protein